MQKIIEVTDELKRYYYLAGNCEYNVADNVVVDIDGATEIVRVVAVHSQKPSSATEDLQTVIRKVTENDLKKQKENQKRAQEALEVTKQKVRELKLEMKVATAKYSLDGSKVIISFTAEDRVDFRELLKALASALKTRIELKQIGQRDEVKVKGGIGICGEVCCCKRFLKDFEHVTVKMAKNQGLSLSPTKISGVCGRLLCCLGYENSNYEEIIKQMPKVNSLVKTPDGEGQVVYNDILKKQVSVKMSGEDGDVNIYPLESIIQKGKES